MMKELFFKIGRAIFYFFAVMFIITSISTISEGGNKIMIFISIGFGFLILPIVYKKITTYIFQKYNNIGKAKIIIAYILITFLGYMISIGNVLSGIDEQNKYIKEKQKIEALTTLEVEYSINEPITTLNELTIDIKQENINELFINDTQISFSGSNYTYKYPLELGINEIIIQGINKDIERKSEFSITRITQEEQEKQLELAQQEEKRKQMVAEKQKQQQIQNKINEAKEELNNFIALVDNHKILSYNASTVKGIEMEALLFGSYAITYEKYKDSEYSEIKKLAGELESKLSSLQSKQFPKMRKAYVNLVNTTMWEYNIDVYSKGSYNGTIEFIGGYFASNKNKLDIYSTLSDMLKLLRFDRANFKWYEYDDSYTYWEINSLPDSKVSSSN